MIWLDGTTSDKGITSVPTLSGQQRGDTQLEMYAPLPPPNCVWNTSWNEFYIIVNLKVCRWCNNIHTLSLFSLNLWIRGDLTLKMKGCVHFHLLSCPKTKCKTLPCLLILPKNNKIKLSTPPWSRALVNQWIFVHLSIFSHCNNIFIFVSYSGFISPSLCGQMSWSSSDSWRKNLNLFANRLFCKVDKFLRRNSIAAQLEKLNRIFVVR